MAEERWYSVFIILLQTLLFVTSHLLVQVYSGLHYVWCSVIAHSEVSRQFIFVLLFGMRLAYLHTSGLLPVAL